LIVDTTIAVSKRATWGLSTIAEQVRPPEAIPSRCHPYP